jgi:multisubunit Na+/H+ antiporter MnhB subunit
MGASRPVQAALSTLSPMSRGLTRFVLVAIAIASVAAVVIHLFAPDAMRALGRSLHGG